MLGRRQRVLPAFAGLLFALWALLIPVAARQDAPPAEAPLRVGQETLNPCEDDPRLWCGELAVPLDRDEPKAVKLTIGYAWLPASETPVGTIVVQEGGPGYPTIGSFWYWKRLYGPMLATRNLLMVDVRGSGRSTPIDCPELQGLGGSQSLDVFQQAIAACGQQLNASFARKNGKFIHASDLFGTVDAVADLADVIRRLEVAPVDLYGVSYGSFFAQAFAARYPDLLRSLTLDSTWPLRDSNPWYPATLETIRFAFDAVCERSAACRAAAPGSATARLGELATALAAEPLTGEAPRADDGVETVTVAATDLAALAWSAGVDARLYRDLDAAGRAALAGDPAPLLRLAAGAGLNGSLAGGAPAAEYSVGLAVAVPCTDYPQPFAMTASRAEREAQYAAAVAALPDDFFAPFTLEDWLNNPIQDYDQCLFWPKPTHQRLLAPEGEPLVPPTLPVLLLAGDLDSATALGGAEAALAALGPSARLVVVPSAVHAIAQGDIVGCGTTLVRAFVENPGVLADLDVSCVAGFPEIRATGVFPRRLAEQPLPEPAAGNEAAPAALRLAALAVATAGDAVTYPPRRGASIAGLRGGAIASSKSIAPRVLTLQEVRYAEDVAVSGTVTVPQNLAEPIVAELEATVDGGMRVTLTVTWPPNAAGATATIEGMVIGAAPGAGRIVASMPAP